MGMTAWWLLALPALLACGGNEPPPAPVAPAVTLVDAAAPPTMSDSGLESETKAALLPSGDYEITTEVKADSCSKLDAGTAGLDPVTLFVQMKVWRDKSGNERVTGNFPLPMPRVGGFGSARSDIVLSPRASDEPTTMKGVARCPNYETKTLYRVLEQSSERVKVQYTRDYGDAAGCTAKTRLPSKCGLDYVYTFKLVNKVCDPHCEVAFTKGADGGLSPKCNCGAASAN